MHSNYSISNKKRPDQASAKYDIFNAFKKPKLSVNNVSHLRHFRSAYQFVGDDFTWEWS